MSFKPRAMVIVIAVGFVAQLVLYLLNSTSDSVAFLADNRPESRLPIFASLISFLACACMIAVDLGLGALYAYLASRGTQLRAGDATLGGMACGAAARFTSGVLGLCLGAALYPFLVSRTTAMLHLPPGAASDLLDAGLMTSILSGGFGLGINLLLGSIAGGVGGAIGGVILLSDRERAGLS